MTRRLQIAAGFCGLLLAAGGAFWWNDRDRAHFLIADPAPFAAQFPAPPARDSASTRRELDELLRLQATRTADDVAAARADRKTRVQRFYAALGLDARDPPRLPRLEALAERVEDDVRIHVRAVKERFRRLRPYEIDPRLEPCIGDVKGDLSYPSGHAAYAWSMAYLLARLVPERKATLEARAEQFARQRAVCGVHFFSDLAAGKQAARELVARMERNPGFRSQADAAARELRSVLGLADSPPSH